jgi:trans-aconitate methyltransferase
MAKSSKYSQGLYEVKNAEKYVGKKRPFMRSSWETVFARMCDNNPAIIQWASEPFMIPYRNPFTGKKTVYVPDFFIQYVDKNKWPRYGVRHRA